MTTREPVLVSGLVFAVLVCALVHLVLGFAIVYADAPIVHHVGDSKGKGERRHRFGEVAFERRGIETDCTSIAECEITMQVNVSYIQPPKLGMKQQDKRKLPELQTYETPEKVEEGVNVDTDVQKLKPVPFKEFKKRNVRRRKKSNDPFKDLDVFDEDPRKRPTKFEDIVGDQFGDVHGTGTERQKFRNYFDRAGYAIFKQFDVSTTLTKAQIRKQRVLVRITGLGADGAILGYEVKQRARKKAYTVSAEACLKKFMPSEGGNFRLPAPDAEVLEFVNKKGLILDLDGRLFQR